VNFAATQSLIFSNFSRQCSNHCRPKRLKPEQQSLPRRLQYGQTEISYRSAARRNSPDYSEIAIVDDEVEMNRVVSGYE
jgi:hypothetical protein